MIKGLYVHIPFCRHICGYCDFAKCKYSTTLADKYLKALEKEISEINQESFYSVYIGGGTPTALDLRQLEYLFEMLSRFEIETEYTIEINPETFDLEKAKLLKKYGINRVSIGVESFDEKLLEHMERSHNLKDIENTFSYLDEVGIKNRSIDLMYGFNIQSMEGLLSDLKKAVYSDVTHISIYDLEVYPHTSFGIKKYEKCDSELNDIMYETIIDYLNSHSYKQYETSNFAFGKYQSKHNQIYWQYYDYLGVGLGASGKIGFYRYDNTKNFVEYLKGNYRENEIRLSYDDVRFEAIMMNLRMNQGIDIKLYNQRFETDLLEKYASAINKNIKKGLLEIKDGYLKTTEKGILILNDILVDFMD